VQSGFVPNIETLWKTVFACEGGEPVNIDHVIAFGDFLHEFRTGFTPGFLQAAKGERHNEPDKTDKQGPRDGCPGEPIN